jgi:hypothetical protein
LTAFAAAGRPVVGSWLNVTWEIKDEHIDEGFPIRRELTSILYRQGDTRLLADGEQESIGMATSAASYHGKSPRSGGKVTVSLWGTDDTWFVELRSGWVPLTRDDLLNTQAVSVLVCASEAQGWAEMAVLAGEPDNTGLTA